MSLPSENKKSFLVTYGLITPFRYYLGAYQFSPTIASRIPFLFTRRSAMQRAMILSHPTSVAPSYTLTTLMNLATEGSTKTLTTITSPSDSKTTTLKVTTRTLTNSAVTIEYTGLGNCLQALSDRCEPGSCLAGDGSNNQRAMCMGWIDSTINELVNGSKIVTNDFRTALDRHLTYRTTLVGEYFTYADLFVRECCGAIDKSLVNLSRWMETVDCIFGSLAGASQVTSDVAAISSSAATPTSPSSPPATAAATATATATATTTSAGSGSSVAAPVPQSEVDSNELLKVLAAEKFTTLGTFSHALSKTVEELVVNAPLGSLPGASSSTHTKNLLLRDKKAGLYYVCARPEADTHAKSIATNLGVKANFRLADVKYLTGCLGVEQGCLGPLAVWNDKVGVGAGEGGPEPEGEVKVIMDSGLKGFETIYSHPGRCDWSTGMSSKTLFEFIERSGHKIIWMDFGLKKSDGATSNAPPAGKEKPKAAAAAAAPKQQKKTPKEKKPQMTKEEKEKFMIEKREQQKKETAAKKQQKGGQKDTLLALQYKKEENFAMWYTDVIVLSEMISYYDISGCYILRPWSFKMWEVVMGWFNDKLAPLEVENTYFPMFVSQDKLEREKDHVEGFAPEVAWVTKSGDGELAKPIAIRPTSETVMYPYFKDWIKSHRDLPLRINQWANVVRWEFKYPTPFLRSREFLWQEGHTAHATYEEADKMVMDALELYRGVYEDLMAIPVIRGYKTEKEKFAGGHQTTTCEAYIPTSGRAIQGATSHNLGKNFGKMFDINFQDKSGKSEIPWQTSWGITTRTIGVCVMVHGDDKGLVIPPKIAPFQVVVVPIPNKSTTIDAISPYCEDIITALKEKGIRCKYDDRTIYNPGWKYNHWEQKGVPVRIEVGPRDIEGKRCRVVTRVDGAKEDRDVEGLNSWLSDKLASIQQQMFDKVKKERDARTTKVYEWKDFVPELEKGNLILTPWCGPEEKEWEEWVKDESKKEAMKGEEEDNKTATSVAGKSLCIPFEQPELPEGTKCFASGKPAKCWCLWGRSY